MLIRHGRAGQRQHGVDIVGRHGARYPVGLQCKQKKIWPLKKLTTAEIDDEVNKAKGLVPKLQALWILTTAEDDAPVQAHVRAINESHATKGLFEVAVLGWSEIVRRVTLQHRVAAKHFGAWGAGETSPLLATFMIQDGSLETKDEALRVTVQELTLDLAEFPNGHVVVRRRESDHLLVQIKSLPSDDGSIDARKKRIELRKQLKAHTDRERTAERALAFALSDPHLAPMILQVWEDDAAETIRAIIEDSIDPGRTSHQGEFHLWPPGITTFEERNRDSLQRIKVWFPHHLYADLVAKREEHEKRYSKPMVDHVCELPASLRSGYAIPAILRRLMQKLEDGQPLEKLRSQRLLDIASWGFDL